MASPTRDASPQPPAVRRTGRGANAGWSTVLQRHVHLLREDLHAKNELLQRMSREEAAASDRIAQLEAALAASSAQAGAQASCLGGAATALAQENEALRRGAALMSDKCECALASAEALMLQLRSTRAQLAATSASVDMDVLLLARAFCGLPQIGDIVAVAPVDAASAPGVVNSVTGVVDATALAIASRLAVVVDFHTLGYAVHYIADGVREYRVPPARLHVLARRLQADAPLLRVAMEAPFDIAPVDVLAAHDVRLARTSAPTPRGTGVQPGALRRVPSAGGGGAEYAEVTGGWLHSPGAVHQSSGGKPVPPSSPAVRRIGSARNVHRARHVHPLLSVQTASGEDADAGLGSSGSLLSPTSGFVSPLHNARALPPRTPAQSHGTLRGSASFRLGAASGAMSRSVSGGLDVATTDGMPATSVGASPNHSPGRPHPPAWLATMGAEQAHAISELLVARVSAFAAELRSSLARTVDEESEAVQTADAHMLTLRQTRAASLARQASARSTGGTLSWALSAQVERDRHQFTLTGGRFATGGGSSTAALASRGSTTPNTLATASSTWLTPRDIALGAVASSARQRDAASPVSVRQRAAPSMNNRSPAGGDTASVVAAATARSASSALFSASGVAHPAYMFGSAQLGRPVVTVRPLVPSANPPLGATGGTGGAGVGAGAGDTLTPRSLQAVDAIDSSRVNARQAARKKSSFRLMARSFRQQQRALSAGSDQSGTPTAGAASPRTGTHASAEGGACGAAASDERAASLPSGAPVDGSPPPVDRPPDTAVKPPSAATHCDEPPESKQRPESAEPTPPSPPQSQALRKRALSSRFAELHQKIRTASAATSDEEGGDDVHGHSALLESPTAVLGFSHMMDRSASLVTPGGRGATPKKFSVFDDEELAGGTGGGGAGGRQPSWPKHATASDLLDLQQFLANLPPRPVRPLAFQQKAQGAPPARGAGAADTAEAVAPTPAGCAPAAQTLPSSEASREPAHERAMPTIPATPVTAATAAPATIDRTSPPRHVSPVVPELQFQWPPVGGVDDAKTAIFMAPPVAALFEAYMQSRVEIANLQAQVAKLKAEAAAAVERWRYAGPGAAPTTSDEGITARVAAHAAALAAERELRAGVDDGQLSASSGWSDTDDVHALASDDDEGEQQQ